MESNRSKPQEPFPGNGSIPLKLRELLREAGIEPDASRRIPWGDLPYALYDKGLYLSGLPASLLFASKDSPTREEQLLRLNVHLRWPFPGVENPLKLLQQACASNSLAVKPRPPGRDVVFEVIKDDGTKIDVGQWKITRPPTLRSKVPATSTFSPLFMGSGDSPTVNTLVNGANRSAIISSKPNSPASPFTPTSKTKVTNPSAKDRIIPPLKKPAITSARPIQPSSMTIDSPLQTEPYPNSKNVPAKLKVILKQLGVPESKKYPGRVSWKALPDTLWSTGQYITGIPASVILGNMDPTIKQIRNAREKSLRFSPSKSEVEEMEISLDLGEIKALPRPKGRDVVFEVITGDGPIDVGKWIGSTVLSSSRPGPSKTPSLPKPTAVPVQRKSILDDSSDDDPTAAISPSVVKGANNKVAFARESTNIFDNLSGRVFDFSSDDSPMTAIPPSATQGFKNRIVSMQPSSSTSNPPSDNDMDTDARTDRGGDRKPPVVQWMDEVNFMMDQLAEMLMQSGVKLPRHPTRENAYKIVWSDLPAQLNDARVTMAGFPLKLLPYWKAQGKLSGKWVVNWKRVTLDQMVELLENDGIGMEKWTGGNKAIVQAIDEDDEYTFTYDDFVNARNDDPEQFAMEGRVMGPIKPDDLPKRKRRLSDIAFDRIPKRQRTLDKDLTAVRSTQIDALDGLNSDHDVQFNTTKRKDGPPGSSVPGYTPSVDSDYYYKHSHDPDLTVAELNSKYRRQKEIIKSIISILIYHDLPCIAPEDEGLAFFLPWSNLPRLLAARMVCLTGWPSICAPVVQNDSIIVEFGPASWNDMQWNALEIALLENGIDVKKPTSKHLFELIDANNAKEMSNVNFGKLWLKNNWGVEADQSVTIFARKVSIMDPIVEETDIEDDSDEEMAESM